MLLLGAGKSGFAKSASFLITSQPLSTEVYEGQAATFTVSAIGATSYQWQFSANDGVNWSNIDGAILSSYTIPSTIRAEDNGKRFRCVVSGSSTTINSNNAELSVWNPLALGNDLGIWFDPTFGLFTERTGSGATTSVVDNGSVGTYRSRNNINGISYGNNNMPIYRSAGLNGTPCVEFDGVDDAIDLVPDFSSGFRNKESAYIFSGMSVEEVEGPQRHFFTFASADYSDGLIDMFFEHWPSFFSTRLARLRTNNPNGGSGYSTQQNSYFTNLQPFVLGIECLFTGGVSYLRKNGNRVSTSVGPYSGNSPDINPVWSIIGGIGGGSFDPFKGKLGHMIIATPSTEFSSSTMAKIEGFINYKSGLIY